MAKLNWNPPEPPNVKGIYEWSAQHATEVHEGDGKGKPARRWTEHATENLIDVAENFRENYQATGDLTAAFQQTAEDLGNAFQDAILDPVYDWPRDTVRSDGSVAGSPRDIVDTGELLNSQSLRFEEV